MLLIAGIVLCCSGFIGFVLKLLEIKERKDSYTHGSAEAQEAAQVRRPPFEQGVI
jgi:hypothetical protein